MPVCEICESQAFDLIASEIREGEGRILKCRECGLIIQDLEWDEARLKAYYEQEYQQTNSLVTGQEQTPREHFEDRLKTIYPVFKQIEPLLSDTDQRVLEIGCGAGSLLSLIKPRVEMCVGIELNSAFVEFIKSDLGIKAYAEDIARLGFEESFDLVISIDTLDHLPNPLETLRTMNDLLVPGGRVYLEVPNQRDALNLYLPPHTREKYNTFFWHRAHLFYFARETIARLFNKAGFDVSVHCRHNYTLKNYLNWYFLGSPQQSFVSGTTDVDLFSGKSEFEKRMNALFREIEPKFKEIMAGTFHGDTLCCVAVKK